MTDAEKLFNEVFARFQTCPGKIEMVSDNRFNISGFGIGFLWNDLKCEAQEKAL